MLKEMRLKVKYIISLTQLATTALTAVENKIPSVSNLVIKIDYNTTITEIKNKFTDHDHIIAHGFRRLTSENVTARLRQANLASKNDIANFVKQDQF